MGKIMFRKNTEDVTKNPWKEKAKQRRIEIKEFKKRVKELIQSRSHWQNEAEKYKGLCKKLESELKKK